MRCTCFKKSPSRFIFQIAIETGTLSQYNGQNSVINATQGVSENSQRTRTADLFTLRCTIFP